MARAAGSSLRGGRSRHMLAIADYDAPLALDPSRAEAYDERGSQHFMLGDVAKSIDDFDAYIKLRPDEERRHWKWGISKLPREAVRRRPPAVRRLSNV